LIVRQLSKDRLVIQYTDPNYDGRWLYERTSEGIRTQPRPLKASAEPDDEDDGRDRRTTADKLLQALTQGAQAINNSDTEIDRLRRRAREQRDEQQLDAGRERLGEQQEADRERLATLNARVIQNQSASAATPSASAPASAQSYRWAPVSSRSVQASHDQKPVASPQAHFTYKDGYETDGGGGLTYNVYVTNDGEATLSCHASVKGWVWQRGGTNGPLQNNYSTSSNATVYPGHTDTVVGFTNVVADSGSYTVSCVAANN